MIPPCQLTVQHHRESSPLRSGGHMEAASRAGRIIGVFIIIQMIGSGIVNFVMEGPLSDAPGFLVNAGPHSRQIAVAVLLGMVTEALWVGIAVTAFPVFRQRSQTMA